MKSPIVKYIGMVTWFITAVCALHVGMKAMGYDLLMRFGLENNSTVNLYTEYTMGVAGAISLIMLVMALTCRSCGCGSSCGCGK